MRSIPTQTWIERRNIDDDDASTIEYINWWSIRNPQSSSFHSSLWHNPLMVIVHSNRKIKHILTKHWSIKLRASWNRGQILSTNHLILFKRCSKTKVISLQIAYKIWNCKSNHLLKAQKCLKTQFQILTRLAYRKSHTLSCCITEGQSTRQLSCVGLSMDGSNSTPCDLTHSQNSGSWPSTSKVDLPTYTSTSSTRPTG